MKKILLFSCDPGGANTIIPLCQELKTNKKYSVSLYGKNLALAKYKSFGLKGKDITKVIKTLNPSELETFIVREAPDYIITGTSAEDLTEKLIWRVAAKLKIPSFAIVDQWVNYGVRFSRFGATELKQYNRIKSHDFLPTKIFLMDEYAKKELIKTGIKASRAVVSGQPYFDLLLKYQRQQATAKIKNFRNKYKISPTDFLITFASEPIRQTYRENEHYWGYTEATILKELLTSLTPIAKNCKIGLTLAVRPHPKENIAKYRQIVKNNKDFKILLLSDCNGWDLILASDLICGMSSMFLIESVILNKPIVSIQIGLKRENPFILARRKIVKSVLHRSQLDKILYKSIVHKAKPEYKFKIVQEASKNIINYLEKHYV